MEGRWSNNNKWKKSRGRRRDEKTRIADSKGSIESRQTEWFQKRFLLFLIYCKRNNTDRLLSIASLSSRLRALIKY